jgi:N-acetylmuramoyl-L-alanine amidase
MPPVIEHPSPNAGDRAAGSAIDMIVLHYTDMADVGDALDRLCDPRAQVSAHYVIGRDGTVWRLVEEERRAWHAGVAQWRDVTDVNSHSIGIELDNPGHSCGYVDFAAAQIAALIALCADIVDRRAIPPEGLLAHSDVSPDRKQDPGHLFPWPTLAAAGLGLFPAAPDLPARAEDLTPALRAIGYAVERFGETACIAAFQRRYRPGRISGFADVETAGLAKALLSRLGAG